MASERGYAGTFSQHNDEHETPNVTIAVSPLAAGVVHTHPSVSSRTGRPSAHDIQAARNCIICMGNQCHGIVAGGRKRESQPRLPRRMARLNLNSELKQSSAVLSNETRILFLD